MMRNEKYKNVGEEAGYLFIYNDMRKREQKKRKEKKVKKRCLIY